VHDEERRIHREPTLVLNENLEKALTAPDGREVLFAVTPLGGSDNDEGVFSAAFLAIPAQLDGPLRRDLEAIEYGLLSAENKQPESN